MGEGIGDVALDAGSADQVSGEREVLRFRGWPMLL